MPITITAQTFDEVVMRGQTPVLLEFWATWCVPCNLMKRSVEKAAASLAREAVVGLVNVDQEEPLVERFGVRGTPMFVLVRHGEVVTAFGGMATSAGVVSRVRRALADGV